MDTALAAQPGLRWEVYTRFAVFVSWCGGPSSPSASLASSDEDRNDQAKTTQPCSWYAGQCLKPLFYLAEKEALSNSTGLGLP